MNSTNFLNAENQKTIRDFLLLQLSGAGLRGRFIFRRVKNVTFPKIPIYSKYTLPDEEPKVVHPSNLRNLSREEIDKSVKISCPYFRGLTESRAVREGLEDTKDTKGICSQYVYGKQVSFSSDTYHTFDVTGLTFDLVRAEPIVPISGDLLCIWLSDDIVSSNKRMHAKMPAADAWFIASDQHLRAFTAIMYGKHESLTTLIPKNTPANISLKDYDAKLKEKLFCGNRLMTNSWLKSKLAHAQNGVEFTRETSIKTYWHLRTENASKYWVDVWAALVLIARYGELPSENNVPNTKGGEYQRVEWHLPEGFVKGLLEKCGIECNSSKNYCAILYCDDTQIREESECDEAPEPVICPVISPVIYWPDDAEIVREWMDEQEKKRKEKKKEEVPDLKSVPTPVKVEKKKRTVLEIAMTINWGEAEEGENKY